MERTKTTNNRNANQREPELTLDAPFFDHHESSPIRRHAPPEQSYSRWLTLNQIRKMQRMRRETVLEAMNSGELPYEQRGRIRYARLADVLLWEERRLAGTVEQSTFEIDPDFADLAMPAPKSNGK